MEHPNIAQVLDAGETEIGAPFFVMELVKGRSITSYCKQNDYDVRQRLALLIPVCQAVHHAHQKGIIHRDMKPGNIMVMDEAGKAVPKVIDFGIAKVLEGEGSGHTIATGDRSARRHAGVHQPGADRAWQLACGHALGRVCAGRDPVELLCGTGAHHALRHRAEADPHPAARSGGERPPKPSTIEPSVKGDLDWITLKALERDPNRRYGSASDLADDITRFLKYEPIVARPPSRGYMITRFVRRHRIGVAAAAAIAFAVVTGGITSTAMYFKAERNRIEAELGPREPAQVLQPLRRADGPPAHGWASTNDAVAYLARALRTDPANELASTNLLSLLANTHLIRLTRRR
jgi:hypothetical protein